MLGALIGDIVGSRFEWNNLKSKEFDFLTHSCAPTDDSMMTLAIAEALLSCNGKRNGLADAATCSMQTWGRAYPGAGYGGNFAMWIESDDPAPYNSWGNGAAMRVSPCAWAAKTLDEALELSKIVTEVTHNHPEGVKGAAATTAAIFLAREGKSLLEIRDYIDKNHYKLDFKLDDIRANYTFDVSCQGSVPQAIEAFLESASFEDAIRNAISIGGDSDTIAAITGSIAEAYYGIPAAIRDHALTFLDKRQLKTLNEFESKYGLTLEKTIAGDVSRSQMVKPKGRRGRKASASREDQMLLAIDVAASLSPEEQRESEAALERILSHAANAGNAEREGD